MYIYIYLCLNIYIYITLKIFECELICSVWLWMWAFRSSEGCHPNSRTSTASAAPLRMSTGPLGLSLGFLSLGASNSPNRVAMPQLYWREPACSSTEGHSHPLSPSYMHCAHQRGCVLLYWDVLSYACTCMYVHTCKTYDRMSACMYVSMCGRICICTRGCSRTCTCGCIDVIHFWNRSHAKFELSLDDPSIHFNTFHIFSILWTLQYSLISICWWYFVIVESTCSSASSR